MYMYLPIAALYAIGGFLSFFIPKLENTFLLGRKKISADVVWGKKHEKVKRKRGKM
jgi:hypothetical protein